MTTPLPDQALRRLFLDARSLQRFRPDPVDEALLRRLYDLAKWAPTGFNAQPARFLFVRSAAAKERLAPALSGSNRAKMLAAPVTTVVAYDRRFFERLPALFPKFDARPMFRERPELAIETAERNSSLQAAFLILAARALGLDAGPMSGFDAELIDRTFFADDQHHTLLLVNLGYAVREALPARAPRLDFDDVARVL